jgi:hypothetical protein
MKIDDIRLALLSTLPESIESEINNRRCVKSKDLRNNQTADNGDAERFAQFASDSHTDASGNAPNIAAIVLIMIGRKRTRQA